LRFFGKINFCFILSQLLVIFASLKRSSMPKRVKPTAKGKSMLALHTVVFAIVTAITWMMYDPHNGHWAYPWPAWTTAAWSLLLLGHFCVVFTSTEDAGYDVYRRQQGKA
jgi:hypothetical protein